MRGRIGGRIGVSYPPSSFAAGGVWRLADVYAARSGAFGTDQYSGAMPWPATTLTIAWPTDSWSQIPIDYVDATATGSGTFSASVTASVVGLPFSYYWERSTNAGSTWSVVSGSGGSSTAADNGYGGGGATVTLNITGQTVSNDNDKYRLVVTAGLKTYTGPTGTLRFDTVTLSGNRDPVGATLTSNFNNYFVNLTVAAGTNFSSEAGGVFVGTEYSAVYLPETIVMQVSVDGGSTWQNETNFDVYEGYVVKSYTASAADNGKKWRAALTFRGQNFFTGASTLTVT
jgi:hypothetical protein